MNQSRLFFIFLFFYQLACYGAEAPISTHKPSTKTSASQDTTAVKKETWPKKLAHGIKKIWHEGNTDLYMTGYAWHNRYLYSPERIDHFNEHSWGGGLGKGLYDNDGNWHALYGLVFLDSHKYTEPWAGYGFLKTLKMGKKARIGGGFTVAVTQRPDITHGYPFPAAAPLASVNYKRLAIFAAYIPGAKNVGNVLFLFARWSFGNQEY